MENFIKSDITFFVIIILLFFVILALFAVIGTLLYLYTKSQKNLSLGPVFDEQAKIKKDHENNVQTGRATCYFHENNYSQGLCAICEKSLCEICVKAHDKLLFCPDHYKTFLASKWVEMETFRTTPQTPLEGIDLYNFKHDIWSKTDTPTYLVTHYKINVENDLIESYVTLYVRENELQLLKEKFAASKVTHH